MDNFTALRNGILEHRRAGKMPPFDSGIFDHLLARCNWQTGIYHGCALSLAFDFGDISLKEPIQRCLRRLRDRKYINYPQGTGKRGGYDILIHKYEIVVGKLSGMRLNAWAHNGLAVAEYEPQNGRQTVDTLSANGRKTVGTPIQDIQDIQDRQDGQSVTASAPSGASKKHGTRIPAGFAVTNEHSEWALKNGLPDPHSLIEDFKDYWQSKAGNDSMKLDWNATFRRWIRTSVRMKGNLNGNGYANRNRAEQRKQSNLAAGERALEILERRLAN